LAPMMLLPPPGLSATAATEAEYPSQRPGDDAKATKTEYPKRSGDDARAREAECHSVQATMAEP
jgi:hypothetical protein